MKNSLPIEMVFHPSWWHTHYGISFDESFYLDSGTRIENDIKMRRALWDRFGLGVQEILPRPVLGSMFVAGGFVLPALFGVKFRFSENDSPWPESANLSRADILDLRVPDLRTTWPMDRLIKDADRLRDRFGYVVGDFDTDGLLNTALHLRGQQLFTDFIEDPELVAHLFDVLTETYRQAACLLRTLTGSCSIATNRSVLSVDPSLYLHSNCSVSMISPRMYAKVLLPYEARLAASLQPYGIHHCGGNAEKYAPYYATLPVSFLDVGWGSAVDACRKALPLAFLNLRLSPVRMANSPAEEIRRDATLLVEQAGGPGLCGLCCINMDASTPDENVRALLSAAREPILRA